MKDYVRWVYRLDCTPRYIICKELDKLKLSLDIRALRYDLKLRDRNNEHYVKKCWLEKERMVNKDLYSIEKEKFYNSKGWGLTTIEEMRSKGVNIESMTRQRERDIHKQLDEVKIREAKYNTKYKEISIESGRPKYLSNSYMDRYKEGLGDEIRTLLKLRCDNLEEVNKYWKEEKL